MTPRVFAALAFLTLTPPALAERGYSLRVDNKGWGNGGHADIVAVLRSACDAIDQHRKGEKLDEPIFVRRGKDGPITLFRRNLRGEIIVQLDTGDRFWCQYAYQMAHEFCHVLCRFREGGRENLWFEESLCELASIFAMRSMAESWKADAPYTNWRGYSKSIRSYVTDVEKKYTLTKGTSLAAFYKEHAEALTENATDRDKNGKVAMQLLPLFEAEPEHWSAVAYVNRGKGKDDLPFAEHLRNWHDQAPPQHREFIKKIAKEFGFGR